MWFGIVVSLLAADILAQVDLLPDPSQGICIPANILRQFVVTASTTTQSGTNDGAPPRTVPIGNEIASEAASTSGEYLDERCQGLVSYIATQAVWDHIFNVENKKTPSRLRAEHDVQMSTPKGRCRILIYSTGRAESRNGPG